MEEQKYYFKISPENIEADLIIVDYADILRPMHSDRNSNSYSEAGGIYEELRGVAGEKSAMLWKGVMMMPRFSACRCR